jgi:hypothetical protein
VDSRGLGWPPIDKLHPCLWVWFAWQTCWELKEIRRGKVLQRACGLQPTRGAAWTCTLTKTFILVYEVDLLDRYFESSKKFVKGKSFKGEGRYSVGFSREQTECTLIHSNCQFCWTEKPSDRNTALTKKFLLTCKGVVPVYIDAFGDVVLLPSSALCICIERRVRRSMRILGRNEGGSRLGTYFVMSAMLFWTTSCHNRKPKVTASRQQRVAKNSEE